MASRSSATGAGTCARGHASAGGRHASPPPPRRCVRAADSTHRTMYHCGYSLPTLAESFPETTTSSHGLMIRGLATKKLIVLFDQNRLDSAIPAAKNAKTASENDTIKHFHVSLTYTALYQQNIIVNTHEYELILQLKWEAL